MTGLQTLTFGCRLNTYESEQMTRAAREAGLDAVEGGAIIVNTCAVTAEAVRQAKQAIRRARRARPDARIVVSGCAAQTEPETFAAMEEVDLVLGNAEKLEAHNYRALPDFGVNLFEKVRVNDIMDVREAASHMVDAIEGRTRAFVQVQNGCDHRCTFCIIPYGRGNSRSVPAGEVVAQVRRLVDEGGYKEIVLTGVDLTSWGGDLPAKPSLGRLVQAILAQVPRLARLRLSSIDSIEVDAALMEVIGGDARLMPHFHLSLQSGDDMILKRMKRRHSRADTLAFVDAVRAVRPDAVFGADIIAGFPTETDAMFAQFARHRGRGGPDAAARLPVQPPHRHARRADAAAGPAGGEGACGRLARERADRPVAFPRCPRGRNAHRADGTGGARAHGPVHAGHRFGNGSGCQHIRAGDHHRP